MRAEVLHTVHGTRITLVPESDNEASDLRELHVRVSRDSKIRSGGFEYMVPSVNFFVQAVQSSD